MNNLLTNEELWAAAKDGDRDALDALVMNNVPFVKKTAGLVFREFAAGSGSNSAIWSRRAASDFGTALRNTIRQKE